MPIIQVYMDNKANSTLKNKSIKKQKNKSKAQRRKAARQEQQLLKVDLVDLVSNQDSQQQPLNNNQEIAHQVQNQHKDTNEQNRQNDVKNIQVAKDRFLFLLKVNQYYKVKIEHQQLNKTTIQPYFKNQEMVISGKIYSFYQPNQQFILFISRQLDSLPKKQQLKILYQANVNMKQFCKSINLSKETVIFANRQLNFQECSAPWNNLPNCIQGNESVMIFGQKNTGKSALSEYLMNQNQKECVLLDCDIGRNSALQGCISLNSGNNTKKIWIGELTPLNNLQTYLRAIKYLFKYYSQHYYTKKLIVNTMGYTTGLGEFLLYEIYEIVKPKSILLLQSQSGSKFDVMNRIVRTIRKGEYVDRLYISKPVEKIHPTTTTVFTYQNPHATSKKINSRFQKFFQCGTKKVNHLTDLITLITSSRGFNSLRQQSLNFIQRKEMPVYEQSRHKKEDLDGIEIVSFRRLQDLQSVDMRLVVLGRMVNDSSSAINDNETGLFQVQGLGFGFQSYIYSNLKMQGLAGVVSEGIDFEKGFYHLNEKQLIDLQLRMGRVHYIMVMAKGLGAKGMRNNPSKVQ